VEEIVPIDNAKTNPIKANLNLQKLAGFMLAGERRI
jgi:hypothetical protein